MDLGMCGQRIESETMVKTVNVCGISSDDCKPVHIQHMTNGYLACSLLASKVAIITGRILDGEFASTSRNSVHSEVQPTYTHFQLNDDRAEAL